MGRVEENLFGNVRKHDDEMGSEIPLDDQVYDFESQVSRSNKLDPDIVLAIVNEIMKALCSSQGGSSSGGNKRVSNFAVNISL